MVEAPNTAILHKGLLFTSPNPSTPHLILHLNAQDILSHRVMLNPMNNRVQAFLIVQHEECQNCLCFHSWRAILADTCS